MDSGWDHFLFGAHGIGMGGLLIAADSHDSCHAQKAHLQENSDD
jgi:hypothetical protein